MRTKAVSEEVLYPDERVVVVNRRDIDVLNQFRAVRVNVSIPTDSEEVRLAFEPKAPPLERRWQAAVRAFGACVTLLPHSAFAYYNPALAAAKLD